MDIITIDELYERRGLPEREPDPLLRMLSGDDLRAYQESLPPLDRYFVIDGSSGLYLLDGGGSLYRAFAEEANRSWERIQDDRPRLVDSWRAAGPQHPTIIVEAGLSLVGKYDADAYLFGFNLEAMEKALQDGVLGDVIGHEFGHGWCHTQPDSAMSYKGKLTEEIVRAREDEANAKAVEWGFDMRRLEHWGNDNREWFAKITKNPAYRNPFTPVV